MTPAPARYQVLIPVAALALPVLGGAAFMTALDAPPLYPAANVAALATALVAALFLPLPTGPRGRAVLAAGLVAVLLATAIGGVEAQHIRRWFALGTLRLHAGYLVLPLLIVLAGRLPGWTAAALIAAALFITALQPDAAACLGLAAAAAALAERRRDAPALAALAAALVAAAAVLLRHDPLTAVPFVENVLLQAFMASVPAALLLAAAQCAPLALRTLYGDRSAPLIAYSLAIALAGELGPYPSPLIGFGAAPILGLGLALAGLRNRG